MKAKLSLIIFLGILCLGNTTLQAQQTAIYYDPDEDLKEGIELFYKEKYGAAQDRFNRYLNRTAGKEATSRIDAQYFESICALRLDQRNAEVKIEAFLDEYPESAKANEAAFEMAKISFQQEKYRKAVRWFQKVNSKRLSSEEKTEYAFKNGYCFFEEKEFDRALPYFQEILASESEYTDDATYYYGYIQYLKGNYETALGYFLKLTEDKSFKGIVPFYIAQILYLQEKYEEVIDYAPGLMKNADNDQRTEIARIIGDAHFRLKKYAEAVPYLEQYRRGVSKMNRQEHYQLGFAYYMNNQLQEAVGELEQVKDGDDPLSQNSNHLLGGILINLDDKYKARNAFRKASILEFDKAIQEESMLNYAKLNFDLSISGETIKAFEEFLTTFPDSKYNDEVYDYLVKAFINTRNYKDALVTLDKIENKNSDLKSAYQRIAFYRGLEMFNNLRFKDAINMFDKSLEYGWFDAKLKALCHYWTGEAWYRLESYDYAIEAYNKFLISNQAYNLPEYNLAHYNLGYSFFKQDKYTDAMSWFRKFTGRIGKSDDKLLTDAYNRIGDCYYINRSYWQAIEYYDKASALRSDDADYALFQKGFTLGLVQRPNKKIEELDKLISVYPKSNYADDAMFEIGKSLVEIEDKDGAITTFRKLISTYSTSSFVRKSYLQLGLIYYNGEQNDQALDMYKKVVNTWPESPESKDALAGIKNIYVDQNRVDEYFDFIKSAGQGADVSVMEQDSLSYIAAENIFMEGDCTRARQYFDRYLQRFPNGQFLLNAHYYRADCYFRSAEYDKSLSSYEYILSRGSSEFSELAQIRTAAIYYHQEKYEQARVIYVKLVDVAEVPANIMDARIGLMRSNDKLKRYPDLIKSANDVLYTDKIPDEIIREATFKLGKAYLETGKSDEAFDVFSIVAKDASTLEGAEAKYHRAQIQFNKGNIAEAEKEVLDFLDKNTTHQYWLARAYILWSDIYMTKDDLFQAKATLQILNENYDRQDDGIRTMVADRLNKIENLEK